MLVWKAISSMPFTILATWPLLHSIATIDSFISFMVRSISSIDWHPASTTSRASTASDLAFLAFSAVPRIILVISSSEALVSSTEAACWIAPDESEALDSETLRAAEAVSVALRSRSTMAVVMLAIVRFHSRSMTWRARLLACITHHARPATSRNPPRSTANSSFSRRHTSLAADFSSAALVCVAKTTA